MSRRAILVGAAPGGIPMERIGYSPDRDLLICADGGRNKLEALGLRPDWYVGDNDSGGTPEGLPSVVLPAEKDVSDMEMAVERALQLGCTSLVLTGCTGGRLDHALANIGLLEQIAQAGADGVLMDPWNEVRFLNPGIHRVVNQPPSQYLGLIALDARVEGLTLMGVKYPLRDFTLRRGTTRTISNAFLNGTEAQISFTGGSLLLIRSHFSDAEEAASCI